MVVSTHLSLERFELQWQAGRSASTCNVWVEHQRRPALAPPGSGAPSESDVHLPLCIWLPETPMYPGVRIRPRRNRSTRSLERRNCSC